MSGFFCLYIDQFPAWVWEQSTITLRRTPFVVIERGHVVSASPTALLAGVTVGMTSARAQARFRASSTSPGALGEVERDARREELAWSEVQRTMYGLTPQVEAVRQGLLFAQVESAKTLSLMRGLSLHGGHAQDRATAQLAAVTAPPATARSIKAGRERAFTDGLALSSLQGTLLSQPTLTRLAWFGWTHLGHLRPLSRRQLEEQFGPEGTLLFNLAQGPLVASNRGPVATWKPPAEIVARIEFEVPVREPAEWNGALDELLTCACGGLGTQQTQTLEIEAATPIRSVLARRVLKEPLSDPRTLHRPTETALRQALETLAPLSPIVQSLTVRLGGLVSAPIQPTLFEGQGPERGQTLDKVVEHLESRFAGRTGRYALLDPHSPFPEEAYRWLPTLRRLQSSRASKSPEVSAQRRRGGK
ncbi:hypothetical protein IAD21_06446 (plasmid) [Abditibacteriota bacterium]|nr:hypothetical protein IAD21_06446 [Abditibacteriota bacterium]